MAGVPQSQPKNHQQSHKKSPITKKNGTFSWKNSACVTHVAVTHCQWVSYFWECVHNSLRSMFFIPLWVHATYLWECVQHNFRNMCIKPLGMHASYLQGCVHHTFRNTCIKPLGVCATYLMECVYQNFRNAYMKSLRMRASYLWECVQHTFRNACIIPLGVCASYLKYVFSFWVRVCIFFFWVCTRDAWGGAFRPRDGAGQGKGKSLRGGAGQKSE